MTKIYNYYYRNFVKRNFLIFLLLLFYSGIFYLIEVVNLSKTWWFLWYIGVQLSESEVISTTAISMLSRQPLKFRKKKFFFLKHYVLDNTPRRSRKNFFDQGKVIFSSRRTFWSIHEVHMKFKFILDNDSFPRITSSVYPFQHFF